LLDPQDKRAILMAIYKSLQAHFGLQHWWPTRSGSVWEIMMGAVLTQRTTWRNVERALDNVERAWGIRGLSDPELVLEASHESLIQLLRPAGHFSRKPLTLQALARLVVEAGGVAALKNSPESTEDLREKLLAVPGIGPETADAILLYALGRPVFVADAYAVRLASRWGILDPKAGYYETQRLFTEKLSADARLFNEYHALIVALGKETCMPRPLCEKCPLNRPIDVSEDVGIWRCLWPLGAQATDTGWMTT